MRISLITTLACRLVTVANDAKVIRQADLIRKVMMLLPQAPREHPTSPALVFYILHNESNGSALKTSPEAANSHRLRLSELSVV